jgi:hypothetical protein
MDSDKSPELQRHMQTYLKSSDNNQFSRNLIFIGMLLLFSALLGSTNTSEFSLGFWIVMAIFGLGISVLLLGNWLRRLSPTARRKQGLNRILTGLLLIMVEAAILIFFPHVLSISWDSLLIGNAFFLLSGSLDLVRAAKDTQPPPEIE